MTFQITERQLTTDSNTLIGRSESIGLECGEVLFVVGANGTGKSALMHKIYTLNQKHSKRIVAHRQTWFESSGLEITSSTKTRMEGNIANSDIQASSRWKETHASQRSQMVIFNLISSENQYNREITKAVQDDDMDYVNQLKLNESPLRKLNRFLNLANLPISISIEEDDKVFAKKENSPPYSIAELSDGERNAILIAVDVLTAKDNTLFIIDEPDRHLHRSIVSPLLSSLFKERPDCAFVIATHDLTLPLDNPDSNILAIRGCKWKADVAFPNVAHQWDADFIKSADEIDDQIKQDILGARRTLLFVEGTDASLDKQIYRILFPNISVLPKRSCSEVEKSVKGINSTDSLNWVRAFGLIDGDDRSEEDIKKLKCQNIFALPCYSVESIYYSQCIMQHIATRQAKVNGTDSNAMAQSACDEAMKEIKSQQDRLCAKLCVRKVQSKLRAQSPSWQDISTGQPIRLCIEPQMDFSKEKTKFNSLFDGQDAFDKLVRRYPVKDTSAPATIARKLDFLNKEKYENAVRIMLMEDEAVRNEVKSNLLGELSAAIENPQITVSEKRGKNEAENSIT